MTSVTLFLERIPAATVRSPDAQGVAQLREVGSRRSQPHQVEFFLYFPSETAAQRVADRLTGMGLEAEVMPGTGGDLPWLTFATRSMLPEVGELERLREVFDDLCAGEAGRYDGWGTPVVE